jgi:hypothetical protein
MSDTTVQQNMDRSRGEHLIPGREIHMKDMRAYRFCEVGLIAGTTRRTPSRTSGTRPAYSTRRLSGSPRWTQTYSPRKPAP